MFMSLFARQCEFPTYTELAGLRVLVTGLNSAVGVDTVRALADHKARLVIQSPETTPAMTELAAVLAEDAAKLRFYNDPFADRDAAVRLVQATAEELGGIDAVINLVHIDPADCRRIASVEDVESFVTRQLEISAVITRVAANRMRLTLTEGSILNVVTMPASRSGRGGPLADITRAVLADLTRAQAREWESHGIRVNAVGPASSMAVLSDVAPLTSDADLAALALHLASEDGRDLSGHILDAAGLSTRRC